MKETNIQALSLVEASRYEHTFVWRNQTGKFRSMDAKRIVNVGVKGAADSLAVVRVKITPEMVGSYIGVACAMEFKVPKTGRLSEDQKNWARKFSECGGKYAVIRSPDEAKEFIESVKSGK
ncbi:hypothetical protein [Acinetobacter phage HFM1]|nr:hypothetical protein [Acinetobacter phage HFM1]